MTEPSLETETLYSAIGRLTIAWTFVEAGIDHSVLLLHRHFDGNKIEQELPWALGRKIRLIRKCIPQMPIGRIDPNDIRQLMDDVARESQLRHDIVHGVMTQLPEAVSEVEMVRLLRGDNGPTEKRYTVTKEQIILASGKANNLAAATLNLATILMSAVKGD